MTPSDQPAADPPTAMPRSRRGAAIALTVLAAVVVLPLLAVVGLIAALHTTAGTAAVLRHVPDVSVVAPSGSLLGGDFAARRITVREPGTDRTVVVAGLRWTGLQIGRGAGHGQWLSVRLAELHADRVDLGLPPGPAADRDFGPPQPPTDLHWPLELLVAHASVDSVHVAALGALGADTIHGLQARLHFGADGGARHRIDGLALTWDRLSASADARIDAAAPFALAVAVRLAVAAPAPAPAPALAARGAEAGGGAAGMAALQAQATVSGPLAQPSVELAVGPSASASASASAARSAGGALRAHAVLAPFETWRVKTLAAAAEAFDAAAWIDGAPQTSLSGTATVASHGAGQPARVAIALVNAAAGRVDAGRMPLRRLSAAVSGTPGRADSGIDVTALDADLGGADASAGRVHGTARWTPGRATASLQLAALAPAALDARAPAMQLDGSVELVVVPEAASAAPATPAAPASGRSASGPGRAASDAARFDLRADIRGRLAGLRTPSPVRLRLDAGGDALRIAVRGAEAGIGAATATLSGTATRDATTAGAPWRVQARSRLDGVDPFVWWPGAAGAQGLAPAGPTRLDASGTVDLAGLVTDGAQPLARRLQALRGSLAVGLGRSTLAGVPLAGDLTLRRTGAAPTAVALHLDAAGNRVDASGSVTPGPVVATAAARRPAPGRATASTPASSRAPGTAEGAASPAFVASGEGTVTVDAPDLSRLAPLWPLVGTAAPGGGERPVQGALHVNAHVTAHMDQSAAGPWPEFVSNGRFDAARLRFGTVQLAAVNGRWTVGSSLSSPVDLALSVENASVGAAGLDSASVQLGGTGRAHELRVDAALKALPPAWVDALQAPASAPSATPAVRRTALALTARGGLVDVAGRPGGWRGTLAQVDVRTGAASAPPLLHAADVGIDYRLADPAQAADAADMADRLTVQPGRLDLLGAALRWSRLDWQSGTPARPARLDGRVDLDPLRVAPFLAQLQPAFGWSGDLALAGHAALRSTPGFGADIVVERRSGDLSVTTGTGDESETRALALTTLRISLVADGGTWRFTPAIAGNAFGVVAGAVTARTAADDPWPAAGSALDGVVTLSVGDLNNLGGWVPAGWRLRGALQAAATIGGTVGAPTWTGELRGTQLGVRNFVQGVDVTDGDLYATLRGTTATVDHFTARAGAGTLRIDGGATLGAAPRADLSLTARSFQAIGRVDRRIVTSGTLQLALHDAKIAVAGKLAVDEGLIDFSHADAPTRSADVRVRRGDERMWSQKEIEDAQNADSALSLRALALDLQLSLGNALKLRGRGFQSGLTGDLHLTSPAGQLAIDGAVRTTGGTYAAYGQKLDIDRGVITFAGPADNPRLDVEAIRSDLDSRVGVIITGTALDPKIRLFSEPDMSDIDKISMLMLGHASDGLGGSDLAILQSAALGLLSGEGGGEPGTSEKFTKAIGLDALSVRQGTDSNARDAVVSLGKQISQHWYVGYERGLGTAAGSVQLIYRIARRITLRAQSGSDNSVDAIWSWRWQ